MTSPTQSSHYPLGTVVLGMSRSGTSAVARMLIAAGFHAGSEAELLGAHDSNPLGHFENRHVVQLHEDALAALDATWFDAPEAGRVDTLRARFAPRIAAVVDRLTEEAGDRPVVIKDPRVGILTGLWDEQLDMRMIPLLVLRDPREIALSLRSRDGTPLALGMAGWELHTRRLLAGLHGRETVVVRYAELIEEPQEAGAIVADLARGLPEPLALSVRPAAASRAIEPRLHRSRAGADPEAVEITQGQSKLWTWLQELPRIGALDVAEGLREPDPRTRRRVAAERRRCDAQAEIVVLRERVAALERAVQATVDHAEGLEWTRDALTAEKEALTAANAELIRAHQAVEAELRTAAERAEYARIEAELARQQTDAILATIRDSRSWRLTRPLRASGALARQVIRRPSPPRSR